VRKKRERRKGGADRWGRGNQREREGERSLGWAEHWRDGGGPSEGDRAAGKGDRVSSGVKERRRKRACAGERPAQGERGGRLGCLHQFLFLLLF
jgi:hypothetical protein